MRSLFTAVAAFFALLAPAAHAVPTVLTGADRILESPYLDLLRGKRVGILAHSASRDRANHHVVDLLFGRPDLTLKMIFAPEHGFRSVDDTVLPDSVDPVTGLPLYSLYGPRLAPSDAMMAQLDVIVIDLQDVGVRYYTYPATMTYTLQAAARAHLPVIVLDRPNPIGGAAVVGSILEPALANGGLTSLAPIPTRHGMTLGELARLFNVTLGIHANLTVVPVAGWDREKLWSSADGDWHPPSPALTDPEQAYLYSFLGPLEALNLAVGRGISNRLAFRQYGAPWISAATATSLVTALRALKLPGLEFEFAEWTPDRSLYMGQLCRGFHLKEVNIEKIEAFRSQILVLQTVWKMLSPTGSPGGLLSEDGLDVMLGSMWLMNGIQTGADPATLMRRAQGEVDTFLPLRRAALLY